MIDLHIGRSPAYSAEMILDRCCLGSPTSFLISSPTSPHRPHSTEPHMAGLASRSELLQRRSMASTGPPAGRHSDGKNSSGRQPVAQHLQRRSGHRGGQDSDHA
jgi:hypothetical protein